MTGPRPGRWMRRAILCPNRCPAPRISARCLSFRGQSGDLCPDRQLQDRPGSCPGPAATDGPMTRLAFAPHIPLELLAGLAVLALAITILAFARGARGAWARGLAFAILLFALAGPILVNEV